MILIIKEQIELLKDVLKLPKPKSPIPIMSNALIEVIDGLMTVKTSDSNVELTRKLPVESTEDLRTTVNASKLLQVISSCKDDLKIDFDKDELIIKSARKRFKLPTLNADDYPVFPGKDEMKPVNISSLKLSESVKSVLFAAGINDARYMLNGVSLSHEKVQATDGYRGTWVNCNIDCNIIIPRDSVAFIPDRDDGGVSQNGNIICISFDDYEFKTKLIDANSPDINMVVNRYKFDNSMSVKREEFIDAIKSSLITADSKQKRITLNFGKKSTVKSTADKQDSEIEFDCEINEDFAIAVNAQYLLEALSAVKTDIVSISYSDSESPLKINDEINSIIMPVKM